MTHSASAMMRHTLRPALHRLPVRVGTTTRGGTLMRRLCSVVCATLSCAIAFPSTASAQGMPPQVRQIVTFLFQPGRAGDATAIYQQQLVPIYRELKPLVRFRAYREAESPEPLDLVIISSYDGMAGMDAANDALRRPTSGASAFALYGTLSAMTQTHHDQFVEMIPALSDSVLADAPLTVFEYIRLAPGAHTAWEAQLLERTRPAEAAAHLYQWSETGRMLVSDGWDYLRIFGIRSLGDWHRYQQHMHAASPEFTAHVAARKTLILKQDARLSVR